MKRLAIASHASCIKGKEWDGISNVLIEALGSDDFEYLMVRHSMDGKLPSIIRARRGMDVLGEHILPVLRKPAPLRYISEFAVTILYFTFKKKVDVYVGINPLNAVAAVILKKLHRIDRCVFYASDYSPTRFSNKLLNSVYHAIDQYCIRNADEVWCVSTRIQQIHRQMGLPDEKNILVPNVPPAKFDYLRRNEHNKQTLITNGIIDKQLDFEGVIRAVAKLKDSYSDLQFIIIGNGPEEGRLKKLARSLKVADLVHFKGKQPLSETLALTSKAGVGLSLYTGIWGFNHYGDSTKCREFAYFGLPIITTDSHSTVQEIVEEGAGMVVEQQVDMYIKAIITILEAYDTYAEASSKLGKKYHDIHKRQILKLIAS